jgi:hypothetical protein
MKPTWVLSSLTFTGLQNYIRESVQTALAKNTSQGLFPNDAWTFSQHSKRKKLNYSHQSASSF